MKVGRKVLVPQTHGISPEFGLIRNMIPEPGGRYVNDIDADDKRRVVFLGDQLAVDLFGKESPVGKIVRLDGVPFLVVGVMKEKEQDSSYGGRDKDKAIIPASTFQAVYGDKRYVDDFSLPADERRRGRQSEDASSDAGAKYRFDPSDEGSRRSVGHHRGHQVHRHLLPRLPRSSSASSARSPWWSAASACRTS
jgi:putative ABC transport system permease protein